MILLDLFCGAGGAAMGYHRAGFSRIVGVDHKPQPNYPFEFIQADALHYLQEHTHHADLVHASPPCQRWSTITCTTGAQDQHPDLITPTRDLLHRLGLPYVIENVPGAPLHNPVTLCGSSFGLGVRRHRLFETNPPILLQPNCLHHQQPRPLDVTGTGGPSTRNRKPRTVAQAKRAMGIDWMTRDELAQAIPPAFTEWIGRQMILILTRNTNERRLTHDTRRKKHLENLRLDRPGHRRGALCPAPVCL